MNPGGLDGLPSRPTTFFHRWPGSDDEPPFVAIGITGEGTLSDRGRAELGPEAKIVISAHDSDSGVAAIQIRWDRGQWSTWNGKPLRPTDPGKHRLEVKAWDWAGNLSKVWALDVGQRP